MATQLLAGVRAILPPSLRVITGSRPHVGPTRWHAASLAVQPSRRLSAQAVAADTLFDAGQADKVNVYTAYVIYKAKSAMSLKMIRPRWEKVASGMRPAREGSLLLEFASARGEREYDWQNKETFSLSATECADLLEALDHNEKRNMFHDPNKMREGEGSITKSFSISPNETGFFFSLLVKNQLNSTSSQFSTPLSKAEVRAVRVIFNFAIPRLLGMDEIFNGPPDVSVGFPGGPPPF